MLADSFLSAGETEDYVEGLKRRIIENGGIVVGQNDRANYVVQEDGYFPQIWQADTQCMQDAKQRNIVHPRWLDICISNQSIVNH